MVGPRITRSFALLTTVLSLAACAATSSPPPSSAAQNEPPITLAAPQCDQRVEEIRAREAADRGRARDDYSVLCDEGCGVACWSAGVLYHRQPQARRDDAKAFAYYERSCAAKAGVGCAAVASSFRLGYGTARRLDEAKRYFKMACELSVGEACTRLGELFDTELESSPDSAEAARDYLRGCELRDGDGCAGAGELFVSGRGVAADARHATELYVKGCEYGGASACMRLGHSLEAQRDRAPDEGGVARQRAYERGVELARTSCGRGEPRGCSALGDAYRDGKAIARDTEMARRLYRIGCEGQVDSGCAGLSQLGDVPDIDGTPGAGAVASDAGFDCAHVRCRGQSMVRLLDGAGHRVELNVSASPYVRRAITLFPGDDFFVTGDEQGDRLVNLRYVDPPATPRRVLHVRFSQQQIASGQSMVLEIQSYFPRWTSYHALVLPISQPPVGVRATKTCPVEPMNHARELWPEVIGTVRLGDVRFDDAAGPCVYY